MISMAVSVDELKTIVANLRKDGLSTQQIADELSLSQDTVAWFLTSTSDTSNEGSARPTDMRVGWRTIGVRPTRIAAIGHILADVALEECGDEIDTVVGISLNGILFANEIASELDSEVSIYRSLNYEDAIGSLSNKYGRVSGKNVMVVDDVLSTGATMRQCISDLQKEGANVVLAAVLLNKTTQNEVSGVPLRGLIRATVI